MVVTLVGRKLNSLTVRNKETRVEYSTRVKLRPSYRIPNESHPKILRQYFRGCQ